MKRTNIENNLSFIVTGSGRCGTRWLAHLLDESECLTVYHEPLLPFMRKFGRGQYAKYIEFFEAERKETGAWGGVSAAACEHIETLLSLGIKVVGLCRDGTFAVRSIRDHQSYLRLEGAIELWVDRNKRLLDSGIPIWRLEDLNEDFNSVLSLCQFLDCSIEYPVWQRYAGIPDNRGLDRSGGRLQPGGLSIFYAEAGAIQSTLGYEVPSQVSDRDETKGCRGMKIAVTGGSGFIGNYLVNKLLAKQHEVTVIDIRAKGPQYRKGLQIKLVDVEDFEAMKSALQGIDVVYHLAGFVVSGMRKDPFKGSRLQLNGTLNVLEASRLNRVSKVILASSFYVYDGLEENIVATEETPLDIREMELFSASKLMAEALMQEYHRKYGLQYLNLRFGSAYGYGDCSNVIKTFIETGLEGETIEVWGAGKRRNQYTYVEDIAEGCVLALSQTNKTFNLISPQLRTTQELAQLLRTKCGFDIVFDSTHEEGPNMAYMSSEKAIEELHWKPRALSAGLDDMLEKMYPDNWVS